MRCEAGVRHFESSQRRLADLQNAVIAHGDLSGLPWLCRASLVPAEDSDSEVVPNFLHTFFDSLSTRIEPKRTYSKDLQTMRELFDSILELRKQNILSEDELNALATFLASRFVERRFDKTISTPASNEEGALLVFFVSSQN